MRLNKHILFIIVMNFFILLPYVGFNQTQHKNQLIKTIQSETNQREKYLNTLSLGEFYNTNNIGKADSMKHVILQNSRNFDDAIRLSALLYSAEVNELQGKQEEYYMDVFSCIPFVKKVKDPTLSFKVFNHLKESFRSS